MLGPELITQIGDPARVGHIISLIGFIDQGAAVCSDTDSRFALVFFYVKEDGCQAWQLTAASTAGRVSPVLKGAMGAVTKGNQGRTPFGFPAMPTGFRYPRACASSTQPSVGPGYTAPRVLSHARGLAVLA